VDNDELECQLAFPPLSSVAIPSEQIGFEAAKRLDRMLGGCCGSNEVLYLPPVHVVTRHSTSMFAIDEPIVTAALYYIRNHLTEPLNVNRIAAEVVVRRRVLEQKFRTLLGRSVLAEIHRARVERAKQLLAGSGQPMSEVARHAGFLSPQRMAIVFRKLTGRSPGEYRRQLCPPVTK
jgi:LacI family transcriptional regulator, galactose operon repressor